MKGFKPHTRNQKRMYRIHKQEEKIQDLELLVGTLQQENQELKEQLEVGEQQYNDLVEEKEELQEQLSSKTLQLENQEKEFIEYINKTIKELECDDVDDEEMKGYLIQRIDTFKEILSKYKDVIGEENEKI